MGFFEKVLLFLFVTALKTKRIAKSAVSGRINYQVKYYAPYVVGALIVLWALFIFTF